MTASHLSRHRSHRPLPPIILSATSYFGISFLFIAALWLSKYNFFPTIRDSVKVPVSVSPFPCFMDGTVQITMDVRQRLSLDLSPIGGERQRNLQAATIQRVANKHNIYLSPKRLQQLAGLPTISTGIQQLAYIDRQPANMAVTYSLSLNSIELQGFITALRETNAEIYQMPTYLTLRIDGQCKASSVSYLFSTLQAIDINRFKLATVSY